jgi:hypothetical protein
MTVLLIVAFGLLPILSLLTSATRQEALDESVVVAQSMALRQLERTVGELLRGGFAKTERSGGPEKVGLAPGEYSHEVAVEAVDPEAFLWRVAVKVRWTLPDETATAAADHVYELERLVSRPDASFTGAYPFRRLVGEAR